MFGMSCTNNSSTPSSCEACHKGKNIRFPFPNSCTITYFSFQIIHCDLWTSPIESITGFKYYLILIDDYSCYTWTFPLRFTSDVPSTFCEFYQYVLMQFRLPIQSVQCDNGKEFDNHALGSFFSKYGIVFRFSCLHTSPQNGKAERGIRIITNILCTLLFQGHLPA
jgi:transposase InsO family protein